MRNFSPREKSIAVCDGHAPEDGDLPQKCAERFLKKPLELEIQAEEWKTSALSLREILQHFWLVHSFWFEILKGNKFYERM